MGRWCREEAASYEESPCFKPNGGASIHNLNAQRAALQPSSDGSGSGNDICYTVGLARTHLPDTDGPSPINTNQSTWVTTCGGYGVAPAMALRAERTRRHGSTLGGATVGEAIGDGSNEWILLYQCNQDVPGHASGQWMGRRTASRDSDDIAGWDVDGDGVTGDADDSNILRSRSSCNDDPVHQTSDSTVCDIFTNVAFHGGPTSINGYASMSTYDNHITYCWGSAGGLRELTIVKGGAGGDSPMTGVTTNIPGPPLNVSGSLPACAGATITVTPWDGDACDGLEFRGWADACKGSGECTVTMDEPRSVTALFGRHDCGPATAWDSSACACAPVAR